MPTTGNRSIPIDDPAAFSRPDQSGPVNVATLHVGFGIATLNNSENRQELPKRRNSNQRIGDTRKDSARTSQQQAYGIELEQADQQPIQSADDNEEQRYGVQGTHLFSPLQAPINLEDRTAR